MAHTPYENDPLRWVAAEVRYPRIEEFAVPPEFRDAIRGRFPIPEQQTELSVSVGPTGPAAQQVYSHRFLERNRLMSITVGREALALETTQYAGWSVFRDVWTEVLRALAASRVPDGIVRLGLRYIDEVRLPEGPDTLDGWRGWVDERLISPCLLDDQALPTNATIVLQYGEAPGLVTLFRAAPFGSGRTVQEEGVLRMPFKTPEGPYFLLDTDASWVDPERRVPEFELDRVIGLFDELHEPCQRLFEASITQRLRDEVLGRPGEEVRA